MSELPLETRRQAIRRRAFANLLLILRDTAERTDGRLYVDGLEDAVVLRYRDVVTLVAADPGFALARRDFSVLVVAPPLWPFDRHEALVPIVIAPVDFRHPNSDSHQFCLDTRGISPERLAELIYDNIRVRNRRLDHCVDLAAADFVRATLGGQPADPRPLFAPPAEGDRP
jgi:hypothetical protein